MENKSSSLIVGLGNPGADYQKTRHNLGFLAVEELATKWGIKFKKERLLFGELAKGESEGREVLLLKPQTYMNLSANSAKRACDFFKIPFKEEKALLIVADEFYLKFGTMRLRSSGSSGGHNGLKSVEQQLASQEYCRLRLGIGPKEEGSYREGTLEKYVLERWTQEELTELPEFISRAARVIECWLKEGVAAAQTVTGEKRNEEK